MIHPNSVLLVESLHKATLANRVPWQEMPQGIAFIVEYPNYSIVINAISRPDMGVDGRDYDIEIRRNGLDRALERITAAGFGQAKGEPIRGYAVMAEIFHRARRRALSIDTAMNELLRELLAPPARLTPVARGQTGFSGSATPSNGGQASTIAALTRPAGVQGGVSGAQAGPGNVQP